MLYLQTFSVPSSRVAVSSAEGAWLMVPIPLCSDDGAAQRHFAATASGCLAVLILAGIELIFFLAAGTVLVLDLV